MSILTNLPCNFEKKNFFSGVTVSVSGRRKAIEVTFVSFGLYTRRFTVECTKYATRLFHILKFSNTFRGILLWIQGLEYLQCHMGLLLYICYVNFDLVKFRENWKKEF